MLLHMVSYVLLCNVKRNYKEYRSYVMDQGYLNPIINGENIKDDVDIGLFLEQLNYEWFIVEDSEAMCEVICNELMSYKCGDIYSDGKSNLLVLDLMFFVVFQDYASGNSLITHKINSTQKHLKKVIGGCNKKYSTLLKHILGTTTHTSKWQILGNKIKNSPIFVGVLHCVLCNIMNHYIDKLLD